MSLDDLTTQEKLTPEERRGLLRAFADRMLLKITAMDDPEDMPGVEKAVRVAAVIERLYSRCDRAERQTGQAMLAMRVPVRSHLRAWRCDSGLSGNAGCHLGDGLDQKALPTGDSGPQPVQRAGR